MPKATFSAWKELSAYFVTSATGIGTRNTSPGSPSYSAATASPLAASSSPITVFGGSKKSRTLVPSRRNSGFTATPKSTPAVLPDAFSRIGTSSSRQVPGSIVLRKTTVCRWLVSASAPPICSATRSRYVVDRLPLGADGVPTQTREISVAAIAAATSVVARSAPLPTTSAVSSPMRSSTTGACPRSDEVDLGGVDVDSDDLVPPRGQARGGHAAHVAQAKDADLHAFTRFRAAQNRRDVTTLHPPSDSESRSPATG